MRSTSSTWGWWFVSPPTQVTSPYPSAIPRPLEFRTIPPITSCLLRLRRTMTLFKHSNGVQGPIREIGSSHGRWGISKTTPLSYTSPVAITPNWEKLTITPYIMFVSFSCRRIRQASSPASTMPAGCRRRGLLLQSTMAFAGFRTIVSCTPTEAAFSFVLQRLRAGCTPGSGR
jgi:hypothetical protein